MVLNISPDQLKNILHVQWITGITVMVMLFTLGLTIGWTSPYQVLLTSENSPFPVTENQASWVASLLNLGRFIGAIAGGIFVEYYDSKRTLVLIGFPLVLGWICIIAANSVIWLYVARMAAGISVGMAFSSFPIFLGEIASPSIRGALVALAMTGMPFGTLVGNIMGAYMSMALFAYISLVPNVVFILLFLWIPQSPYYLIRKGLMEDAKKAIAQYNPKVNSQIELESLKSFIATSESKTYAERLREFNIPQNRKAGLITLMLYFFMQFSGLNTVLFYQESILTAAGVSVVAPATLVMISSAAGVVSGWLMIYIADKFERKMLMIISCIGVGISMAMFAIHFNLLDNDVDPDVLQWLPITAALLFIFFVSTGITSVPNIILSEFFAPSIKKFAACFASISIGLFSFASSGTYLPIVQIFGQAGFFWGQVGLMVLCLIFSMVFISKTRGKSLKQIQDELMMK